jgi:predicted transposase YbfD/YdcC
MVKEAILLNGAPLIEAGTGERAEIHVVNPESPEISDPVIISKHDEATKLLNGKIHQKEGSVDEKIDINEKEPTQDAIASGTPETEKPAALPFGGHTSERQIMVIKLLSSGSVAILWLFSEAFVKCCSSEELNECKHTLNGRDYYGELFTGKFSYASLVRFLGEIPGRSRIAKSVCRAINRVSGCWLMRAELVSTRGGQPHADESPAVFAKLLQAKTGEDLIGLIGANEEALGELEKALGAQSDAAGAGDAAIADAAEVAIAMEALAEIYKKPSQEKLDMFKKRFWGRLPGLTGERWEEITNFCMGIEDGDKTDTKGRVTESAPPPVAKALMSGTFDENASNSGIFALILTELRKSFSTPIKGLDGQLDHTSADRFFYTIISYLGGVRNTDNIPERSKAIWNAMGKELDLSVPPTCWKSFLNELPSGDKLFRAFNLVIDLIGRLAVEAAEASSGKPLPSGGVSAVDGKSLNSSGFGNGKAVVMHNLTDSRLGWISRNISIDEKGGGEAGASAVMIQNGWISRGSVLTCDAASTRKSVIDALLAAKLDYCLAVKGSEKGLFNDAKGAFAKILDQISNAFHGFLKKIGHSTTTCAPGEPPCKGDKTARADGIEECAREESPAYMDPLTEHISTIGCASRNSRPVPFFVCEVRGGFAAIKRTVDKNHGAIIVRDYVLLLAKGSVSEKWGGNASRLGLASQLTFPDSKAEAVSGETRYYLTSLESVEKLAYCARRHWRVEMAHFVLDVALGDDWSRATARGKAEALHMARKIAMALVSCYRAARFKCEKSYDSTSEWIGTSYLGNVGAAFCAESYECRPSRKAA